jgi:hypothetical protein
MSSRELLSLLAHLPEGPHEWSAFKAARANALAALSGEVDTDPELDEFLDEARAEALAQLEGPVTAELV